MYRVWFRVSGAGLSNPKPAPEISGVTRTRTRTQSTRFHPLTRVRVGPAGLDLAAIPIAKGLVSNFKDEIG
jgi:hypothetical protein